MNSGKPFDVVTVAGPTAVGKTAVSIALADRLDGEIVSADSMAVYRGMDTGTAKPDRREQSLAAFHMINVADPDELYNAGLYERQAVPVIQDIIKRGRLPVICGGSGLYLQAAVSGLGPAVPGCDPGVRALIERIYRRKGAGYMRRLLQKADPEIYETADLENPRRVLRLLEICRQTGRPASEVFREAGAQRPVFRPAAFGLCMDRAALCRRIEERVDRMLEGGLEEEARRLMDRGSVTALQAIGYKEMAEYIRGEASLEEARDKIITATRQLAKRQMSWFKRDKAIVWINMDNLTPTQAANEIVRSLQNEVVL